MDLAELTARAQITEIIAYYCHALDRQHWSKLTNCFHNDATYRFGSIDGDWRNFVAAARAVLEPLRISHHQTGNMLIRIDGNRANAETYFTAYHRIPSDAPPDAPMPGTGADYDVVIAGRYIDRFERRDGNWRIAHRTGVTDWRRDSPAADNGLFALPADWRGSTAQDDLGRVLD